MQVIANCVATCRLTESTFTAGLHKSKEGIEHVFICSIPSFDPIDPLFGVLQKSISSVYPAIQSYVNQNGINSL